MNFWKSLTIALIVVLGLSYVGFGLVLSQNLPTQINIGPTVTQTMPPKIVTLLKNSNVTLAWNTTINVLGYKTGFFCYQQASGSYCDIYARFEIDGIISPEQESLRTTYENSEEFIEVKMKGNKMWIIMTTIRTPAWAVMSMSLYLRD